MSEIIIGIPDDEPGVETSAEGTASACTASPWPEAELPRIDEAEPGGTRIETGSPTRLGDYATSQALKPYGIA